MYALVKFYDNIQYVYNSKNIIVKQGVTKIKYSDGRIYKGSIIVKHGKYIFVFSFVSFFCFFIIIL